MRLCRHRAAPAAEVLKKPTLAAQILIAVFMCVAHGARSLPRLAGVRWAPRSDWMIRVAVLVWYEVPVGACCLTEHVGPLILPVECQQAALLMRCCQLQ